MFNAQKRDLAVLEKSLQLVIHFTLKALAVDIITQQENFIMLAKSSLKWHSKNSPSCKGWLHHWFCLANLAAGCKGYASLVMSREVRRRAGISEESWDRKKLLGLELRGCFRASVSLFSFSPFSCLYGTAPAALMSFCSFINMTFYGSDLPSSPSSFSTWGAFHLDFVYVYICICTFLQGTVHIIIRLLKGAMNPKRSKDHCSIS